MQINAQTKIVHKNSKNIPMPTLTYTRLSSLVEEKRINRDETVRHTKSMEDRIMSNGFMDAIKVFPKSNGKYKIAEATHRYRGLKNIFLDEDPMVPIAILDWKNGEDDEELLQTIIDFNNGNKVWELYDYVKCNAQTTTHTKEVSALHKELFANMKRLNPRLSNAVVAGIYTGELRVHSQLRDVKKAAKFSLYRRFEIGGKQMDMRFYVDKMLDRLETLVDNHGKKIVTTAFLRRYVYHLNKKAVELNNPEDWSRFFQSSLVMVQMYINTEQHLPSEDVPFDKFFYSVEV